MSSIKYRNITGLLKDEFGDALRTGSSYRDLHGRDESACEAAPPDCVLFPSTPEQVSRAVSLCATHGMPIIPFGTGSGQEGGVVATFGGLSIDTSGMNRILSVNIEDQDCWVEAGVTRSQLERELHGTGLHFPVDPGADASIGGMAATGAAGTTTPRYGSMHQNVLALEVVMPDATIVTTGTRARKSSSGYDLTHLFVGSEGTLGLITKVCLRLHPLPEASTAIRASFPDIAAAVKSVIGSLGAGIPLARAELMDARILKGLLLAGLTDLPEQPVVIFEVAGQETGLADTVDLLKEICESDGAVEVQIAQRAEDMSRLWKLRHAASEAEKWLRPAAKAIVTDVAVPLSALPQVVCAADKRVSETGLTVALSSHIADGNLHYVLLVDPDNAEEEETAVAFKRWLAEYCVQLDGTISGEHGIGLGKRDLMELAHGPAIHVMRAIKSALDPRNIFNPGKVLPEMTR